MDPISLVAHALGIDAALLVGYLTIFVIVCNVIAKLIPDDSTGWLKVVEKFAKFFGVYVSNRIRTGVSINDIAKATTVIAPQVEEIAKLPDPLNPTSDPIIAADLYEKQGRNRFVPPELKMILMIALVAPMLMLAGCQPTGIPTSPGQIANQTVLDEKGAIAVETAYTAAARAAALAIRSGLVTDSTKIARIGQLDRQAFAAVQSVRAAYNTGNASSYQSAFLQAQTAVSNLLAAF